MKRLKEIVGEGPYCEASIRELAEAAQLLEDSRSDIASGLDTTRNMLHDGLVVLYGGDLIKSPKIVEVYERVSMELKGKRTQPLLMIYRQPDYQRFLHERITTPPPIKTSIAVGIIGGEELEFDYQDGTCYLPTSRHVYFAGERKPRVQDRSLGIARPRKGLRSFDLGHDLDRPLKEDLESWQSLGETDKDLVVMSLAIGEDGIAQWLASNDSIRTNNELDIARELCDVLGIDKIPPMTFDQRVYLEVY